MKSTTAVIAIDRKGLLVLVLTLLSAVLLWFALNPPGVSPGAAASGSSQAEGSSGEKVTFRVFPPIVKIPEKRMRDHGIYFLGSGLEPGQEIRISLQWGRSGIENRLTAVLFGARDLWRNFEELPAANFSGAFAWGLEAGFDPREGEDFIFYGAFDPITVSLWDDVTGELLATAPLIVCGTDRAQPWCDAAQDIVPLGDPNGPAGYLSPAP